MKEKLTNNLGLKFLSIALAIIGWFMVVDVVNPLVEGTVEVPVEMINEDILTKADLTYEVVRTVTKEEKESLAVLPFTAEGGIFWQYYVTAVFANGSEGHASRMIEVDLT